MRDQQKEFTNRSVPKRCDVTIKVRIPCGTLCSALFSSATYDGTHSICERALHRTRRSLRTRGQTMARSVRPPLPTTHPSPKESLLHSTLRSPCSPLSAPCRLPPKASSVSLYSSLSPLASLFVWWITRRHSKSLLNFQTSSLDPMNCKEGEKRTKSTQLTLFDKQSSIRDKNLYREEVDQVTPSILPTLRQEVACAAIIAS